MKKLFAGLILFLTVLILQAGVTSFTIRPDGSYYMIIAYGLTTNGQPTNIGITNASDTATVTNVLNASSFAYSGTLYNAWYIYDGAGNLNRASIQTSANPSGYPAITSWSGGDATKVATLKTLIESK